MAKIYVTGDTHKSLDIRKLMNFEIKNADENEYGFVVNGILVKSYFLQTNKWIDEIIRGLRFYGEK